MFFVSQRADIVLAQEQISGKFLSAIFDGTTRLAEAMAIHSYPLCQ